MKKKNIVVIGAGYTGLVAALRLAQKGHAVTILERGNTVGGLASDFKVEGASLERAYHHLFKTDTSIINLAKELNVGDALEWHDSSVALYYNKKIYPFKGALDLIRFTPLTLINRVRAGLVVLYLQKTKNWKKLQGISAYNWMLKASGKQVTEVIWEPLLRGKFDKYFDKVAMAWLWARIHIRAQSRESSGEKLGYFNGGFQVFTDALIEQLAAHKVVIRKGMEISQIQSLPSGKISIVSSNGTATYDACIATTPSHVFGKLIENNPEIKADYIKQLTSINYLGARLLIFSSDQDLSEYYWHNINDIKLPFLVFINHTRLVDKSNYGGKYIYYIATYVAHDSKLFNATDSEIEKIWFKGIKEIFPHFSQKNIREKHHFRFANAQHIVDTAYSDKIPPHTTPLQNVYLANFSQIFPEDRGTNYAVRDGEQIAELIK